MAQVDACKTVLGIDAAWTDREPSGVALGVLTGRRWKLVTVSPSYDHFCRSAEVAARARGARPDIPVLIRTARDLTDVPVSLVAIDMPLSHQPIIARRASDQAVSLAYGGRWASTHNPNHERPGKNGEYLCDEFGKAGYPLLTKEIAAPCLIEVYPHPALIELSRTERRLPYKASKIGSYWRDLSVVERKVRLIETWREIVGFLDNEIAGVGDALPLPMPTAAGHELKAFEDMLDAVVCVWVGIAALEGRAVPFGDEISAIWIPKPLEG